MSSVEAAASLFGSDSSDTDLFATLGSEESAEQTVPKADLLPSDDNSLHKVVAQTFDSDPVPFSNDQQTPQQQDHQPTYVEYSSHSTTSYAPYSASQANIAYSSSNGYGRQDTTQPLSGTYAYAPPVTYDSYAPPNKHMPPTSSYSAYDPPPVQSTPSPYAIQPVTNATRTFNTYPTPPSSHYPSTKSPPAQLSQTSVLNRPKISNAYDPPFIPPVTHRRQARVGVTQQHYQPPPLAPFFASSAPQPTYPVVHNSQTPPPAPAISQQYANHVSPPPLPANSRGSTLQQPNSMYDNNPPLELKSHHDSQGVTTSTYDNYASHQNRPTNQQYQPHTIASDTVGPPKYSPTTSVSPPPNVSYAVPRNLHVSLSKTPPIPSAPVTFGYPSNMTDTSASSPPASEVEGVDIGPPKNGIVDSPPLPHQPYSSSRRGSTSSAKDAYDPYAPKTFNPSTAYIPRTSSPLSLGSGRIPDHKKPTNETKSSTFGSPPQQPTTIPPYAPAYTSRVAPIDEPPTFQQPIQKSNSKLTINEHAFKPLNSQYAPSPSLIVANDPLARTSARSPVISFGFGGKLVTCFHGMAGSNAGFDVALSSRPSSDVNIRVLHKLLPESVLNMPGPAYPAPLLSDPSTPALSLVRSGGNTQTKAKKTGVLSYLTGRIEEIRQGIPYLSMSERQSAEGKLMLVSLLKIMVESDGRLLGGPHSDIAVRTVLVPRLETSTILEGAGSTQGRDTFAEDEGSLSVTVLRPSALDKIEEFLLRGDRRQACRYAINEKLWAHAMVIASSIDKDVWKDVINDFLRSEFPVGTPSINGAGHQPQNRQSLRVAYSLFAGQGAAAVQELNPVSLLQRATLGIQPIVAPLATPQAPNFSLPQNPLPSESLHKWAETVSMMLSNPLSADASSALTTLGDQLLANNWVEAAHCCYLLSPQTSTFGPAGSPSTRLTLVGFKNANDAMRDPDSITFSEILEFALSLSAPQNAKAQETFYGLPHLHAYRFMRATSLAEVGNMQLASKYCEAITSALPHIPNVTVPLVEQLQGLIQRLSGVHNDKSGSWIGGKISKPSLDTIGGWLEGRFTKLVTGDSDPATPVADEKKTANSAVAGPFAHYSTISSTTPSARTSPQPVLNHGMPVQRTASAMAMASPYTPHPVERSSSATGFSRYKPTIQTPSSGPNSTTSSHSSPTLSFREKPPSAIDPIGPRSPLIDEIETPIQGSSWWGGSESATNKTPTAATFYQVDQASVSSSSNGFISLMDNHTPTIGPSPVPKQPLSATHPQYDGGDDDDLGLGNSKGKQEKENGNGDSSEKEVNKVQLEKPTTKADAPSTNRSWFSLPKLWGSKGDSPTSGPIKASLGEESAFYYDKELKKWVNKKAGSEEAAKPAAPPPPPSRAQTASPGMSGNAVRPPPTSSIPPPPRSASAIDLSTEPPTKVPPPRIRSNLAPSDSEPSPPPSSRASPVGLGPPAPPSRPRSQAAKRNIRSRYVDVLQQDGTNSS